MRAIERARPGCAIGQREARSYCVALAPLHFNPFLRPLSRGSFIPRACAGLIRLRRFACPFYRKEETVTEFTKLDLAAPLHEALAAQGYSAPTPIQRQAIPLVLEGRDLLGIAQTGTGKTAAFALPILNHLHSHRQARRRHSTRVLVLAPTRELARQIADSFAAYGQFMTLSVAAVFGGVPVKRNIRQIASGVDVLVATPGRLLDLVARGALSLADVEVLVLDEADQMLDLGFIHDLRKIVPLLPADRQTLFFSATMPKAIAALAKQYLSDPARVAVAPVATTAQRVQQYKTFVNQSEKQALLSLTLRDPSVERALVFTRTKHGANKVVRHLAAAGIEAAAIHGNKSQPQRERALEAFRSGNCPVLVATDIAARGIDIAAVSHVINFDIPNVAEQYVHRIGRTARAGAGGLALSFVAGDERAFMGDIEKLTRVKLQVLPLPANFVDAARAIKALPLPPRQAPQPQKRSGRGKSTKKKSRPHNSPQPARASQSQARRKAGQRPGVRGR